MKYEITEEEVEAWNATYCKDCPMTHEEYRHSLRQDMVGPPYSVARGFNIGWNRGHLVGFESGYAVGFNDGEPEYEKCRDCGSVVPALYMAEHECGD